MTLVDTLVLAEAMQLDCSNVQHVAYCWISRVTFAVDIGGRLDCEKGELTATAVEVSCLTNTNLHQIVPRYEPGKAKSGEVGGKNELENKKSKKGEMYA